jgi:hypothetical protein
MKYVANDAPASLGGADVADAVNVVVHALCRRNVTVHPGC